MPVRFRCSSCISLVKRVCVKIHSACQSWVKGGSTDPPLNLPLLYSCRKDRTKILLGKDSPQGNMKLFHANMKVNTRTVCEIGLLTSHLWSVCSSWKYSHVPRGQRRSKHLWSETAPLQIQHCSVVLSAIFLQKARMRIV